MACSGRKGVKKVTVLDVLNQPWALPPAMLAEITQIARAHAMGQSATQLAAAEEKLGRKLDHRQQRYAVEGNGVAVLSIAGVIAKKMNLLTQVSGGASTDLIGNDFDAALENPSVNAIVLDVDSPGGTVDGIQELARHIHAARGRKPIVAVANENMQSAAYWIAAAADEIFAASETSSVGSIGVAMQHVDFSEADRKAGVRRTDIFAGKYKRIASAANPLSDEGRGVLQSQVDYAYSVFVNDVANFRGVDVNQVVNRMADGRTFLGRQALDAGLVDGIATLSEVVARLSAGPGAVQTSAPAATAPVATTWAAAGATWDEQCKRAWDAHPELRSEFGTFERFHAYQKAMGDGKVQIIRDRVAGR